ncbi:unnamed protein product [Brassica oleracea var. botrytis]
MNQIYSICRWLICRCVSGFAAASPAASYGVDICPLRCFLLILHTWVFTLQERGGRSYKPTACRWKELRAYGGDGKWQRRWLWKKQWCSIAKIVNVSIISSVVFSQKVRSETRR